MLKDKKEIENLVIGEIFYYNGILVAAVPSPSHGRPCGQCCISSAYVKGHICGRCFAHKRADRISVIFVKEENLCMYHVYKQDKV